MTQHKIIDLTHIFSYSMPVCAFDEPASLAKSRELKTHQFNDWRLTSGMHAGTHIDGPGHLTDSTKLLSDYPVDRFIGTGCLIDARGKTIDASLLAQVPEQDGLIVLILTGQDKQFDNPEYFTKYPVLTEDFARGLIQRKVKMVGIDSFSPDVYPFTIHQLFFKHDILIIENLTGLEQLVGVQNFDVIALPLKFATDSALARVVAVVKEKEN